MPMLTGRRHGQVKWTIIYIEAEWFVARGNCCGTWRLRVASHVKDEWS